MTKSTSRITKGWLSRSKSQPAEVSTNPSRHRSIELLSGNAKLLGTGAVTIIRRPEDALFELRSLSEKSESPPPPIPAEPHVVQYHDSDFTDDDGDDEDEADDMLTFPESHSPPPPSRSCPEPPLACSSPPRRSSLKVSNKSNRSSMEEVPPLPTNLASPPPPPPFHAILLSEVPTSHVDPTKIMVTLETCTQTFRTTLETLTSRPSHLSSYLTSLFRTTRPQSTASETSVYSTASDDMSVYRHHLATQGLLHQSSYNVHIFLDRPSTPYSHILTYLRSPHGTAESLPRPVCLQPSFSQSRLEALLDLRDEAAYLDLKDLYKLCSDELRHRQPHSLLRTFTNGHSRVYGSTSTNTGVTGLGFWPSKLPVTHSQHASVYSLHTLVEPGQVAKEVITSGSSTEDISPPGSDCHSTSPSVPLSSAPIVSAVNTGSSDTVSVRSGSPSNSKTPVPTSSESSNPSAIPSSIPSTSSMSTVRSHTVSNSASLSLRNRYRPSAVPAPAPAPAPFESWKPKHDSEMVSAGSSSRSLGFGHRRNPSTPPAGWI
ncbi:hypothetical protein D9758_008895 [Tetrapyrgos nigripes]|uniref:BTB domain-containing protein n=1 Tax=Tetrapyrgos nigripes TaxID=182062 RepID=A0A8H5CLQ7_9AGAR|nr:hypothetical protein D9758_008895 [Tetrapyrgos nigripes]